MGSISKSDPCNLRKFLRDEDCNSIMQIPYRLVESYGETLPREATLKIDESGRSWKVGIEKFKGHYFFTDGWEKFAKDVDLESREYLLFKSTPDDHNLNPETDDLSKDSGSNDTFVDHNLSGNYNSDDTFADQENGPGVGKWEFTKELQLQHAYRLDLPKAFAKGIGIATKRQLQLTFGEGKKWPVHVTERHGTFSMSGGWKKFLISNDVVVGSVILFKFISSSCNTIVAQVVKKGTGEKSFQFLKRKKGENREYYDSITESEKKNRLTDGWEKSGEDVDVESMENLHFKSPCSPLVQHGNSNSGGDLSRDSDSEDTFADQEKFSDDCTWKFSKELQMHNGYRLGLPKDFPKVTGRCTKGEINLTIGNGKKWPVRLTERGGRFSLCGGWNKFLIVNKVVVGSVMSFKFISSSRNTLEAQVVKKGINDKDLFQFVRRATKGKYEIIYPQKTSENKEYSAEGKDGSDVGKKWRFTKKMKKHHAYQMDIPCDFARGTGIATNGEIKLVDAKGKKWPVQVKFRKCGVFAMISGWNDFLTGNMVGVGSEIIFEWMPSSSLDYFIKAKVLNNLRKGSAIFSKKGKQTSKLS